jgi:hypothetical protein
MTRYANAVGTRIAYDIVGSGPDLIFLNAGIAHPRPAGSAVAQLRDLP